MHFGVAVHGMHLSLKQVMECMGYTGGGSGVLDQVVVQYPHRYDQVRPVYAVGTTRYDQVRHHG